MLNDCGKFFTVFTRYTKWRFMAKKCKKWNCTSVCSLPDFLVNGVDSSRITQRIEQNCEYVL